MHRPDFKGIFAFQQQLPRAQNLGGTSDPSRDQFCLESTLAPVAY
jgi:hypothetical protein